jgi:serine/threonine-protein kinase
VLWELLAGQRLFFGPTDAARIMKVLEGNYPSPAVYRPDLPPALTDACMKALAFAAGGRFATALDFADAIERATPLASQRTVGEWLNGMAAASLHSRAALVKQVETSDIYSSLSAVVADAAPLGLRAVSEEPAAAATQPTLAKTGRSRSPLRLGAIVAGGAVVALVGLFIARRGPSASAAASATPIASVAAVSAPAPAPVVLAAPAVVEAIPSASTAATAASSASAKAPKRAASPKPAANVGAARKFRPTEL